MSGSAAFQRRGNLDMQSGLLRCRPASQKLAQVRETCRTIPQKPSPIQNFLEFGGIRALSRTQVSLCPDVHWIQQELVAMGLSMPSS
jgi:hypothetical protein